MYFQSTSQESCYGKERVNLGLQKDPAGTNGEFQRSRWSARVVEIRKEQNKTRHLKQDKHRQGPSILLTMTVVPERPPQTHLSLHLGKGRGVGERTT